MGKKKNRLAGKVPGAGIVDISLAAMDRVAPFPPSVRNSKCARLIRPNGVHVTTASESDC